MLPPVMLVCASLSRFGHRLPGGTTWSLQKGSFGFFVKALHVFPVGDGVFQSSPSNPVTIPMPRWHTITILADFGDCAHRRLLVPPL